MSLFRFASSIEICYLICGNMFSFCVGIVVPLVMVFWGEMLESFSEQKMNMMDADKLLASQQGSTNMIYAIFGGGLFGVTN